ncbi:MAG: RusA family crossover junction endodeoxyribonuclease [Bacteroidota bacterium]
MAEEPIMPMLPFEFIIEGPPVSVQTKRRQRLQRWKQAVNQAARRYWPPDKAALRIALEIKITYFYEGHTPDLDNIIKPIQDALIGLVYQDDDQIMQTASRKKDINGAYRIRGASPVIMEGFIGGKEFLHIKIIAHEPSSDLD